MVVLNFRDYTVMNGVWGYLALLPVIISFVAHFFLYPIKKLKPALEKMGFTIKNIGAHKTGKERHIISRLGEKK